MVVNQSIKKLIQKPETFSFSSEKSGQISMVSVNCRFCFVVA